MLDDAQAVREVLRLLPAAHVPGVRKVESPKQALNDLQAGSRRSSEPPKTILAEIAARLDLVRCAHPRETGLAAFAGEVEAELAPLAARGGA